jgi:hypothetical protein
MVGEVQVRRIDLFLPAALTSPLGLEFVESQTKKNPVCATG